MHASESHLISNDKSKSNEPPRDRPPARVRRSSQSQPRSAVLHLPVHSLLPQPDSPVPPILSPPPSTSSAASSRKRTKTPDVRSAAACNLCRSQKMKCEGPNHAPCRRCVKNNVDCVFGESQGRARQILWSKRTEELEMKVMQHEEDLRSAMALMAKIQQQHHYLLGLPSNKQPPKRKFDSSNDEKNLEINNSILLLSPVGSTSSEISPFSSPIEKTPRVGFHPYPNFMSICQAIQAARPGPRRSDLVDRGIFSHLRAKELFEVHRRDWAPQIPWLNLPDTFENVRAHSPLMLAVGCSTGAKGVRDVEAYRKAKENVIELVIDVLCYRYLPHDQPQSYQDVIAVIGCIVHCGLGLDPALVVDYAEHLRLRDVFDRIPEDQWQGESDQRQLLSIARTFIGVYIHTVLFSTLTAKPCVMRMNKKVLMMYCDIICRSPYSIPEWDGNLKYFIQYYSIMEEAQINLDSHYRLGSINLNERFAAVEKYSALIHSWMIDWEREIHAKGISILPDVAVEFQLMYHRGMTYMACFATAESRDGREIFSSPRRLKLARQGVTHAIAILRQFILSRLSQHHLPCVHLEYRKATMCIATACIVEACVLIPDHINFSHCLRIIKQLTEELRKEGEEWGGGAEDSYVTTLQKLSAQLDAGQAERLGRQRGQALVDGAWEIKRGFEDDRLLSPGPASPIYVPSTVHVQGSSQRQGIAVSESQGRKEQAHTSVSEGPVKSTGVVYGAPPVSMSPSSALTHDHDLVTSGWLVNSAGQTSTANTDTQNMEREIDHDHQSIVTVSSSPTDVLNPAGTSPTAWLNPMESHTSLHYSPATNPMDLMSHLGPFSTTSGPEHRMYSNSNSNEFDSYPFASTPILSESFQNHVGIGSSEFHEQDNSGDILQSSSFVVPEQTSSLLQSLRDVYSDRLDQTCFQRSL